MKKNIKRKINWNGIIIESFILLSVLELIGIAIYNCIKSHHLTIIATILLIISTGFIVLGIIIIHDTLKYQKNKKA